MEERINILLVEDRTSYREGASKALLQLNPRLCVVAEAASLLEAREMAEGLEALDVVLLHLNLPEGYGLGLMRHLNRIKPEVKVLELAFDMNPHHLVTLVAEAVNAIMTGVGPYAKLAITPPPAECEIAVEPEEDLCKALSPRELEVMELCARGMTARDIADKLFVSRRTVEGHKSHIFEKMGFKSVGELISYAFHHGILYK